MAVTFFSLVRFTIKFIKMKSIFLFLAVLSCVGNAKAQNVVYDDNVEVRQVTNFTSIEVSGAISLYLSQGSSVGVAVSAGDKKYNEKIKTEVKNGVLILSVDGGIWNGFNWADKKLKAYITVTELSKMDISGASVVNITSSLKANNLRMEISGASEVKGNINVEILTMDISGASVARLAGIAKEGNIEASGASNLSAYGLSLETCKASTSGASTVKVTVNNQLTAEASGASNIYYKGAAVTKILSCSGSSRVKNRSGNDD